MNEKPIKTETSSSGGRISYFPWGLRHTNGRRYAANADEAQDREQSSNKTDQEE